MSEPRPATTTARSLALPHEAQRAALRYSGGHGVGIMDTVEDRVVGLKARDNREAPLTELIRRGPRNRFTAFAIAHGIGPVRRRIARRIHEAVAVR